MLCAVPVILMFKRSPCGPAVDDKGLKPAIDKHDASAQSKSVEFKRLGRLYACFSLGLSQHLFHLNG